MDEERLEKGEVDVDMSAEYLEDNTGAILPLMSTLTLLICNKGYKVCNIGYRHPLKRGE
jgi:hypothetical protein